LHLLYTYNMKTIILSTFAVLFVSLGFSQPVLNLNGMPEPGTIISSSSVNGGGINPGAAGANQTWNFTQFPDTGTASNITFVNPLGTPYYSNFPTATSAYEVSLETGNVYGYFKESNSALEILGSAFNDESGDVFSTFTNPQTTYGFPSTLNSTLTDTYRSVIDYSAFGATYITSGTISYVVDAYGTLVTSSGTYPNTLRIKRRDISVDSAITDFGDFVSNSRSTAYEWVTTATGASIGVWTISYDTTLSDGIGPDSYSLNVNHSQGNFTSSSVNQASTMSLSVFPNPASDRILILLPQEANVSILDISGRLIQSQYFDLAGAEMPVMDIAKLPSGTYLIRAEGRGYGGYGKLTVAH
jgi:hypothetical protein